MNVNNKGMKGNSEYVERENREGFQEQCRSEEKARDPGRRSLHHALTTYPILLSE
jgi:hypothetical protein